MMQVLDSYALLAFLENERNASIVEKSFARAIEKNDFLLMSVVNWGEVYYVILRECGADKLNEIIQIVESLPIKMIDVNHALAQEAARFKAFKKISYADCFAASLAKHFKAELITGDKEFKEVEKEIKILWI